MLTHLTASLRVTHRLEHRTENSRRNLRPITLRSRQQLLTERLRHRAAHLRRKRHHVRKHAAVHVLKARQILRSIRHGRSTRRLLIQQVKELIQALRQIRTLLVGATNHPLKRVRILRLRPHLRIIGKQQEQQARHHRRNLSLRHASLRQRLKKARHLIRRNTSLIHRLNVKTTTHTVQKTQNRHAIRNVIRGQIEQSTTLQQRINLSLIAD